MMTSMPSAPAVPTRGSIEGGGVLDLSLVDKDSVALLLYTYKPTAANHSNSVHPSPLPSASATPNIASSQVLINYAALPWGAKPGDYLEIRQIHRRSVQPKKKVNEPEGETNRRAEKKGSEQPAMKGVKAGRGRDGYVFRLGEDVPTANAHQIQVPDSVATAFGLQSRLEVEVRRVTDKESAHTDYVEFYFSQYLGRADMWRLGMSLEGMTLHVGEKVSLAGGAVRAEVNFIIRDEKDSRSGKVKGKRFSSGIVTAKTKTIFRSKSAQVYLFIQLCQETWEFDEDGERYIEKVVHGYLPDLFSRWAEKGTSHVVTIIYFARIYYDDDDVDYLKRHDMSGSLIQDYSGRWCKDFFKVAIDLERRNNWSEALPEIKRQLEKSEKEILLDYHFQLLGGKKYDGDEVKIVGRWSFACEGNALEAINLALNPFDEHHVDRDLSRTGLSMSIITPGTGHFAVDKNLLRLTTERMVDHGMAVDFVCLTKMPLHSVPLFSYVSHRPKGFGGGEGNHPGTKSGAITPDLLYFDASTAANKDTELADCYSLPSWVSCSFYAVTHDKPFRPDRFIPRCKMYEIQMLGILDHNMTTVIVPYLNVDDVPMPRRPLSLEDRKAIRDGFDQSIFGEPTQPIPSKAASPQPESAPASTAASYQSARLLAEKIKEERSNSLSAPRPKVGAFGPGSKLSPIKAMIELEDNGIGKKRTEFRSSSPAPSSLSLRRGIGADSPARPPFPAQHLHNASPLLTASRGQSPNATTRSASPLPPLSNDHSPTRSRSSQPPTRGSSPSRASVISLDQAGSGASTPKLTPAKKLNSKSSKGSFASRFGASWLFGSLATRSQPSYAAPAMETIGRTDVSSVTGNNRSNSPAPAEPAPRPPKHPKLPNPDAIITPSTPSPSKDKYASQGTQPLPIASNPTSRLRRSTAVEEDPISRSLRNSKGQPQAGQALSRSHEDLSWRNRNNALVQSSRHFTINPCKPSDDTIGRVRDAGGRRWRFVLPKQTQQHIVQWPSLVATACLPLTTDFLPNQKQSDELYNTGTYTVQCYLEDGAFLIRGDAAEANLPLAMMREMVSQRLSQNFQVIVLPHELSEPGLARPMPIHLEKDADIGVELVSGGASEVLKNGQGAIWMSWANHIHRLLFHPTKQEIIVHWMTRKVSHSTDSVNYKCLVWPSGMRGYQPASATFSYPDVNTKVNYNHLDHLINGERLTLDPLRYWRTRFVLIPSGKEIVNFPGIVPQGEHLNQTDLLWLGAQKVIEVLNRYLLKRPESQGGTQQAPLRIVTTTFDPSTCVLDEELMMDLERQISGKEKPQGKGNHLEGMTLANVAEMMCQPGNGLIIRTRWWESRQHVQSFTGAQFCEWLQNTFEDVVTREKAAEWAESLLEKGLIEHVTNSHGFLDYWHLYYRLREPYNAASKKEKNKSWFGTSKSTTSSAMTATNPSGKDETAQVANGGPTSTTTNGADGNVTASTSSAANLTASFSNNAVATALGVATTPPGARALLAKMYEGPKERKGGRKRKVKMSQTRVLDLDPNKKSDRAEVAMLHADVVHNARNAFHFELNWLGVTAALLEELRQKLSAQAERYGLRFVETPVEQLVDMPLKCAYRTAIPITLALPPPVVPDLHTRLLTIAHGTGQADNYFEYCILTRKFGFVLDVEAADRYPDTIDVEYSYRKTRFDYSQFCHKTGLALVQCLGGERGFLWSDNRLVVSAPTRRGAGNRNDEARALRQELEDFCNDKEALRKFYEEMLPPLPGEVGAGTGAGSGAANGVDVGTSAAADDSSDDEEDEKVARETEGENGGIGGVAVGGGGVGDSVPTGASTPLEADTAEEDGDDPSNVDELSAEKDIREAIEG
ncbi:vacuolar membrane-associated protein IML1 [Kwoniella heveanensis BCC8398]|uniref:Vacuolar membrane-associated protein IML1 n=1 Tax=Kwoniella heveanensis BCC8398 TaxID=1296120 RepID=A0A1B9GHY9_9TREE|nr:vacuolar membrane-associated protein IML1 [Kwoniella heveanensis BCC8398]